jgi:hypothetical protein
MRSSKVRGEEGMIRREQRAREGLEREERSREGSEGDGPCVNTEYVDS